MFSLLRWSLVALVTCAALPAAAKSWCAYPLFVHEWGVHVFKGDGAPDPEKVALPAWFNAPAQTAASRPRTPVRTLPADGGERDLPVLHFYSPRTSPKIPLGIEVGFVLGQATRWYPDVDALLPRGTGQGPELTWSWLDLASTTTIAPQKTDLAWVKSARDLPALWVQSPSAAERFVFYEGATSERVPLMLRRGATWTPTHRHIEVVNNGSFPVYDVLFVHRDAGKTWVFPIPAIPPGQSAAFVLEDHPAKDVAAATTGALRASLVDLQAPKPPSEYRWDLDQCVMQRDPATPFRQAEGYRLYAQEVDLLLGIWGDRFFGQAGTTITYREDTRYLDAMMPLSLYTDMFNFVVLHRAGLAVWSSVTLP